jgi:hypothetical protein
MVGTPSMDNFLTTREVPMGNRALNTSNIEADLAAKSTFVLKGQKYIPLPCHAK